MMYKGKRVMKKQFDCFGLLIFSVCFFVISYFMAVIVQAVNEKSYMIDIPYEEIETSTTMINDDHITAEVIYFQDLDIPESTPQPESVNYTVQEGDTPWEIAKRFYNDGNFYPHILKINNITNSSIKIGQTLIIDYLNEDEKESILKECLEERYKIEDINIKAKIKNSSSKPNGDLTYLGDFKITGYDPWCKHCCARADGITASGTLCAAGRTIATDKKYPFGTKLYIEGLGTFTVEDRGVEGNHIDVVALSHEEAYKITRNAKVYLVS